MTVKELIKELEKANQDAEVISFDNYGHEKYIVRDEIYKDIVLILECKNEK